MKHFGLIGNPLGHSFSARYFNEKFRQEKSDAEYTLYPLETAEEALVLMQKKDMAGLNVTIPYKQQIIPYLTRLDPVAEAIGAVNTILIKGEERIGYNTDYIGFIESIRPSLRPDDRYALVLGTGGAARAVCYGLNQLGITPTLVSRHRHEKTLEIEQQSYRIVSYMDWETEWANHYTVIVNTTPLGMFPNEQTCPDIPYEQFSARHLLYDCVYNPEETLFLKRGKMQGCRRISGINMLIAQAKAAARIWETEKIAKK